MKIIIVFACVLVAFKSYSQTPSNDLHYSLIWSDEFNDNVIDASKWTVRDWWDNDQGNSYGSSAEPSISLANNVEENNGTLKLHLKREIKTCSNNDYHAEYGYNVDNTTSAYYCTAQNIHGTVYKSTGAQITTWRRENYQYSYGYYEAKIRMPFKHGVHNSFWTFKGDDPFTAPTNASEVDIFETIGRVDNQDLIKTNIHLDYCSNGDPQGFAQSYTGGEGECGSKAIGDHCLGVPTYDENVCVNDYTQWHVYGMELTPKSIMWYIDGNLVRIEENPGVYGTLWIEFGIIADPSWPYTDQSNFDVVHEIDYFRFYELNMNCNEVIDDCSFSFNTYDNTTVKEKITIGSGGCTNTQPAGSNLIMRAKEDITIYRNFEVPLGAELYLDTDNCY